MIVIVDYGMGNIRSVVKALSRLGVESILTSDPTLISNAQKIILPGVGHFARGMENLEKRNLTEPINEAISRNIPILGICLGMQLLTNQSEEGKCKGLGLIDVNTVKFKAAPKVKIPHMGWNTVKVVKAIPLLEKIGGDDYFYFAHSYHVNDVGVEQSTSGMSEYGCLFPSVINSGSVMGVQFHPEKSHDSGLRLLQNFITNY